jgi:hypothetical protein
MYLQKVNTHITVIFKKSHRTSQNDYNWRYGLRL